MKIKVMFGILILMLMLPMVFSSDSFEIQKIQNFDLGDGYLITPLDISEETCPCELQEYSFRIKNLGSTVEEYNFKSSRFNKYVQFIPSEITLTPGSEMLVVARMRLPCNYYGEFDFYAEIDVKNGEDSKLELNSKINHWYNHSITAGVENSDFEKKEGQYNLCIDQEYKIPLKFSNEADLNNKFDLDLKGSNSDLVNSVIVSKNSERILNISYFAKEPIKHYLYLTSEAQLGNEELKIRLPLNVENCYDVNVYTNDAIVKDSQILIPVRNLGTRDSNLEVRVSESDYIKLEESKILVENQSAIVLNLEDVEGLNFHENIDIAIKLDNGKILREDIDVVVGKPFFYTYRLYIVLGIVLILLIIFLIRLKIKKDKVNFEKKKKKTDSIISEIEHVVGFEEGNEEEVKKEVKKNKFWRYLLFMIIVLGMMIFLIGLTYVKEFRPLLNSTSNGTIVSSLNLINSSSNMSVSSQLVSSVSNYTGLIVMFLILLLLALILFVLVIRKIFGIGLKNKDDSKEDKKDMKKTNSRNSNKKASKKSKKKVSKKKSSKKK